MGGWPGKAGDPLDLQGTSSERMHTDQEIHEKAQMARDPEVDCRDVRLMVPKCSSDQQGEAPNTNAGGCMARHAQGE
jgi:hypothetical protein